MTFELEFEVRDYECDLQGIVNNSIYQNYYEHTRHKYLLSKNIDFKQVTDSGIHLVLVRSEIDYKYSLSSGDKFVVTAKYHKISKIKVMFEQKIILLNSSNNITVSKAKFYAVALDNNRKILDMSDLDVLKNLS